MHLTEGALHVVTALFLLNQGLAIRSRALLHVVSSILYVMLDGQLVIGWKLLFIRRDDG